MGDKKKFLVMGVLFAVIVAIGAFQFTSGSEPPAEAKKEEPKKSTEAAKGEEEQKIEAKNPLYANMLPQRDPFDEPDVVDPLVKKPDATTAQTPPRQSPPIRNNSGFRPKPLWDPRNSVFPPVDSVPLGGDGFKPVVIEEPPFGYSLSGIIVGRKPAAVFRDSQGSQRLVTAGSSLDGESVVESVREGEVVVKHRGKTLRLKMGGNPGAK